LRINRKTINRIIKLIRERIEEIGEKEPVFSEEEIKESKFNDK
jgi:hypothetical protein